jgi:hypothetical protein
LNMLSVHGLQFAVDGENSLRLTGKK